MQDIMPPIGADAQLIQSYGTSGFRIGNADYASHVLVLPTVTHAWNGELTLAALAPLFTSPLAGEERGLMSGSEFSRSGEGASGKDSHLQRPPTDAPQERIDSPAGGEWERVAPTEILLIGTGVRHELIAPALRADLKARGLAIDTMDTGAACRTFNILLGEGRRVAVALMLPV